MTDTTNFATKTCSDDGLFRLESFTDEINQQRTYLLTHIPTGKIVAEEIYYLNAILPINSIMENFEWHKRAWGEKVIKSPITCHYVRKGDIFGGATVEIFTHETKARLLREKFDSETMIKPHFFWSKLAGLLQHLDSVQKIIEGVNYSAFEDESVRGMVGTTFNNCVVKVTKHKESGECQMYYFEPQKQKFHHYAPALASYVAMRLGL